MHIGQQRVAQRLLAALAAPRLGEAEEEALVGGEAFQGLARLALQRQLVGIVGGTQASHVGDVLAQGQLAVHMHARERLVAAELCGQRITSGVELLQVFSGPPVVQLAGLVEERTGVVEAVADLVADHCADGAVVHRVVGSTVEERRLQDRGREHQAVLQRHVHRVDGLRQHRPLAVVDRLAQLGDVALVLEQFGALRIAQRVITADLQAGVITPLFGVTHAHGQAGHLGLGAGLGLRRHPRERVDALGEGGDDVLRHLVRAFLGLGVEVLLDVTLADRFADGMVGVVHCTLPAVALLRRAAQRGAVEGEAGIGEFLRQVGSGAVQRVEGQVILPDIQRLGGDQLGQAGHGLGLPDDEVLLLAQRGRVEEGVPVHARRLGIEVGLGPGIGTLGHIIGFFLGGVRLRDLRLQREDALRLACRIGDTGQLQHLCDVGLVLLAQLGHAAAAQVEVTVGHAQAALHQVGRVAVRLQQVHRHPQAEQAVGVEVGRIEQVDVGTHVAAQGTGQPGLVGDRIDGLQLRLHRRDAVLLDAGFVHVGGVVVADQLVITAGLGVAGGAFENGAGVGQGLLGDDVEAAETRTIGRDLGVLHPGAVGEAEEIIAGVDAAVHAAGIEAEAAQHRLGGRRCGIGRRGGAGSRIGRAVAGGQGQAGNDGQCQGGTAQLGHGLLLQRKTPSLIRSAPAGPPVVPPALCGIWLNARKRSSRRHRCGACWPQEPCADTGRWPCGGGSGVKNGVRRPLRSGMWRIRSRMKPADCTRKTNRCPR